MCVKFKFKGVFLLKYGLKYTERGNDPRLNFNFNFDGQWLRERPQVKRDFSFHVLK